LEKYSAIVVENYNALRALGSSRTSRHKFDMAWDAHSFAKAKISSSDMVARALRITDGESVTTPIFFASIHEAGSADVIFIGGSNLNITSLMLDTSFSVVSRMPAILKDVI
jgi:hypothetical protein